VTDRHETEVWQSKLPPGRWLAKCSCGWISRFWSTKREIDDDADEHVRLMAGDDDPRPVGFRTQP